ncbi:MAG: M23 family metallopeptidase [Desulfovibrionales bacterium]
MRFQYVRFTKVQGHLVAARRRANRLGTSIVLALLFGAVLATAHDQAVAGNQDPAVHCPDAVGIGEPLLCSIDLPEQADVVEVLWKERRLPVPIDREEDRTGAVVLLSVGLGERPGTETLRVEVTSGKERRIVERPIDIHSRDYPEQHLTLPPKMVSPSADVMPRILREKKESGKVLGTVTPKRFWSLPLVRPVPGTLLSPFGVKRFLNGEPRAPHKGIDLRGPEGTEVAATAPGIVALTADHYFAGRSVYIDHGQGVFSMYFHLSKFLVREGDEVRQGQPIGLVGSSGRSTGPHLHFGLSVLGEAVNPVDLFSAQPF